MKILFVKRHVIARVIVFLAFAALLCGYIVLLKNNKHVKKSFNLKYRKRSAHGHKHHDTQHSKNEKANLPIFNGMSHASESKKEPKPANLKTPVYVVEEHHEVIPYWFEAVNKSLIRQYGNTLLHIDGHSDMAPPFYHRGLPFFKWPETKTDIRGLMQRNDAFIIGAAMSGLINRVIWVWPEWDKKNHKENQTVMNLEIGWAIIKDPFIPSRKTKAICLCEHNIQTLKRDCNYLDVITDDKAKNFSANSCFIKRSILFEEVHEKVALNLMKTKSWISEKQNILLDIDEDFYGCDYSITPLLDAGVPLSSISSINNLLDQIYCPKSMPVEKEADKMLSKVLSLLQKQSDCSKHHGSSYCRLHPEDILLKGFKNFSKTLFCENEKTQQNLKVLVGLFRTLKSKMLRALQSVGFCLTTTLKSSNHFHDREFKICHGSNTPQHTAVLVHTPSTKDIVDRTNLLGKFLSGVKTRPRVITVCRSVRDGYTPRRFFETVERDVIQTLTKTYKHINLHYDNGLLGGRKGWPHHHHNK